MQYLLDTHSFLWFINGSAQLSEKARIAIENPVHDRYVSTATFWEMAIKLNLGKLQFDRMLISQAIVDTLTIITADSNFKPYKVKQIW